MKKQKRRKKNIKRKNIKKLAAVLAVSVFASGMGFPYREETSTFSGVKVMAATGDVTFGETSDVEGGTTGEPTMEMAMEESITGEPTTGELTTEEPTTEEPITEEPTTEEPTTEEPTTEEPTTEEPTTEPEYEIIDGIYKVKDHVLIEYLGDRADQTVTELVIPNSIQRIEEYVFENCEYIQSVQFEPESSLKQIGQYAFHNCFALTNITLPEGLQKIAYMAFDQCRSLQSITIPSTVTEGNRIMGKNPTVTKVVFTEGLKTIPNKFLKYAYSVTNVTIPSGVTAIGSNSFYHCTGLKKVTIPDTVTTIGSSAFEGCSALTTVKMSKTIVTLGNYAFKKCTVLGKIEMRKTLKTIGTGVFSGDSEVTLLVFANSVGKAYARKNNLKWEYTASEVKRRAANDAIYRTFMGTVGIDAASQIKLKNLTDYVPQGICGVGGYLVVSMYYKNLSKNSILLLYNRKTGAYVKKIVLPSKDHVGSLTNVKGRLVVGLTNISVTDYVAIISLKRLKATKSGATVKYNYVKKIAGYADFATYDGTVFWAGHSANSTTARMYGYKVQVKKKKLVFTKKYSYLIPANTQGLVVKKGKGTKRTFVFSQSYGRLNNSSLITYTAKIKGTSTLGTAKSTKLIPSMSEGMYMTDGKIYVVFESAAGLYCGNPDNTSEIQISNICRLAYSSIANLTAK